MIFFAMECTLSICFSHSTIIQNVKDWSRMNAQVNTDNLYDLVVDKDTKFQKN